MPKERQIIAVGIGMGLLQPGFVSWAPPPLLHKTTLSTVYNVIRVYLLFAGQSEK